MMGGNWVCQSALVSLGAALASYVDDAGVAFASMEMLGIISERR
jgi:hypothetical protein